MVFGQWSVLISDGGIMNPSDPGSAGDSIITFQVDLSVRLLIGGGPSCIPHETMRMIGAATGYLLENIIIDCFCLIVRKKLRDGFT